MMHGDLPYALRLRASSAEYLRTAWLAPATKKMRLGVAYLRMTSPLPSWKSRSDRRITSPVLILHQAVSDVSCSAVIRHPVVVGPHIPRPSLSDIKHTKPSSEACRGWTPDGRCHCRQTRGPLGGRCPASSPPGHIPDRPP